MSTKLGRDCIGPRPGSGANGPGHMPAKIDADPQGGLEFSAIWFVASRCDSWIAQGASPPTLKQLV